MPYLQEIRRVVKPGGRVLFTTPNRLIRLDPGMKPWNSFHVREYAASELAAVLREVFPHTTVKGLMAHPNLYDVEYQRCQRSLQGSRKRLSSSPISADARSTGLSAAAIVKAALPASLVGKLRTLHHMIFGDGTPDDERPLANRFSRRWSVADLYYVEDPTQVDRSLDLMAECAA
jgi:hypothetical protein